VRFCPAPSGWLHVGSVRAALYNWLHARHHGGTFVFRIEDTDASRATEDSMRSMLEALAWVGLDWDEGPTLAADGTIGDRGVHGPYRQSERQALYAAVARRLEAAGATYRDHRTPEELEAWREAHRAGAGEGPPVVKAATFEHGADELARYAAEQRPASLRLRTPAEGTVVGRRPDPRRGPVGLGADLRSGDRALGRHGHLPARELRRRRGAGHLGDLPRRGPAVGDPSPGPAPRAAARPGPGRAHDDLLDDALAEVGFPARDPGVGGSESFAHLPMVVGMDRKKLSKRHGSVSIQEFRRQGFLPETLRNYLALLGWAPKDGANGSPTGSSSRCSTCPGSAGPRRPSTSTSSPPSTASGSVSWRPTSSPTGWCPTSTARRATRPSWPPHRPTSSSTCCAGSSRWSRSACSGSTRSSATPRRSCATR
jgi:glutamyl-tRNA synthetase